MTKRTPKLPVADDLQRRISDAMAKEHGVAGDAELTALLASDAGAQAYAKDLSRIDMWLASWPVPEPSDEAMEALATRIEQRLGENLPGAMSSFLNEPDFADDDSLRDAAASILTAGAAPKPAKATLVGVPSPVGAKPAAKSPLIVAKPVGVPKPGAAPLKPTATKVDTKLEAKPEPAKPEPAKVEAAKPEPAKPEPAKAEAATVEAKPEADKPAAKLTQPSVAAKPEPAKSAAKPEPVKVEVAKVEVAKVEVAKVEIEGELELKPENSGEIERISLIPEPISVPDAPTARALPPKPKKKRKSDAPPANKGAVDDRISIPLPAPAPLPPLTLAAPPSLGAPRSIPPANDRKRAFWPMLAAAAVVGLAVAVGGPWLLSGSRDEAPSTLVASAPEAVEEARWAAPVAAVAPTAPPAPVVPTGGLVEGALAEAPTETLRADDSAWGAPATVAPSPAMEAAAESEGDAETSAVVRARRRSAAPSAPVTRAPVALGGSGAGSAGGAAARIPGRTASTSDGRGSAAGASVSGSATGSAASAGPRREAGGGGSARAAPSGPLPEAPSRDAARDVLDGVAPQVYACFGEEHGLAEVAVIVASSGRVTTSTVSGRFAGTPVGSCIARAIRGARFPEFTNPRFEVHYEYRH